MIEKIGHIKNPLTVIAMFAAIAEISGAVVLPFIAKENQAIYIWFLMLFPVLLVIVFFITLNFNHRVLYAPSDYKDEKNFVDPFGKAAGDEQSQRLREEADEISAEEAEAATDEISTQDELAENTPTGNAAPIARPSIALAERNRLSVLGQVALAEKLAVIKLSKDLGLEFRSDAKFMAGEGRGIIFDAAAIDGGVVHVVEVKLFKTNIVPTSRLQSIYNKAGILARELDSSLGQKLVLHLVAVMDSSEFNREAMQSALEASVPRFKADVKFHLTSMGDLQNEYQFSP